MQLLLALAVAYTFNFTFLACRFPSGALVSAAFTLLAPVICLYGLAAAALLPLPGVALGLLLRRRDRSRVLDESFDLMAATLTAWAVFHLLGGRTGQFTGLADAARLFGSLVAYDVVSVLGSGLRAPGGLLRSLGRLMHERRAVALPRNIAAVVATALVAGGGLSGLALAFVLSVGLHQLVGVAAASLDARERSLTDGLTGLYNYRYFERLHERVGRGKLALILVDCNGLKLVNDRYGHSAGDQLLQTLARVLRSSTRVGDHVIRYGGDEFIAVLPGATEVEAERVAARLRAALEEAVVTWNGDQLALSAAIGVAASHGAPNLNELFARADHAMYRGKGQGRTVITVAG